MKKNDTALAIYTNGLTPKGIDVTITSAGAKRITAVDTDGNVYSFDAETMNQNGVTMGPSATLVDLDAGREYLRRITLRLKMSQMLGLSPIARDNRVLDLSADDIDAMEELLIRREGSDRV